MTPGFLKILLDCRAFSLITRIVLTFIFWAAGIGKAIDYSGTLAEMSHFGLEPANVFAPIVIVWLLVGSALVILDRFAWIGYGALAVFTALTIPIAHPFWAHTGEVGLMDFRVFVEHVSLIGGLMAGAILSRRWEKERSGS